MAWPRRRGRSFSTTPTKTSVMGQANVDKALAEITGRQLRAMALMLNYGKTREETIPMLFDDCMVETVRLAAPYTTPRSMMGSYPLDGDEALLLNGVVLNIDFTKANIPPIKPEYAKLDLKRGKPLLEYLAAVKEVHEQYEAVKHVIRWLDKEGTPGGIRYYWPCILQLVPKATCFADMQGTPTRYATPNGIHTMTQLLKDTANTVAASALIPNDVEIKGRETMWLTFGAANVRRCGVTFNSDYRSYDVH